MRRASSAHGSRKLIKGLTMVELSITLAIVGILSAIAVPNLSQFLHRSGRVTTVNDFMHTIFLARSEAIKRNAVVSICRSVDGNTCGNKTANWESGWIVFINNDHDSPANRDADEEVLHRHGAWSGGKVTSNRQAFSFRPTSQGDVNGTIVFCHPDADPNEARAIIISHTGRPRISQKDASGKALKCG
jgi:type IV fimbrial biogenesis protein FimT